MKEKKVYCISGSREIDDIEYICDTLNQFQFKSIISGGADCKLQVKSPIFGNQNDPPLYKVIHSITACF